MMNDFPHPIKTIHFVGECGEHFTVGEAGITSIKAVTKAGQCSRVPWFAVYKDERLHSEWNAAQVEGVQYMV